MIKKFLKDLKGEGPEGNLIRNIFYSLLTSLLLVSVLYFTKLKNISGFLSDYGFYLLFFILSSSLIISVFRQVKNYGELGCMPGMMIGMTFGMIAGFLPGFFVASTNGMFVGSLFGMILGIAFGVAAGKCCGIMGVMEGVMAGFMGGLMGAMTSFMLLNDNLKAMSVIVFLISSFILFGLSYMIYKETREIEQESEDSVFDIVVISFILTALTTWLMVFGPKSGVFA